MYRTIKAKFANGVLIPLEELHLSEGQEVRISLDDKPSLTIEEKLRIARSVAGAWKGEVDGEAMKKESHESRHRDSRLPIQH